MIKEMAPEMKIKAPWRDDRLMDKLRASRKWYEASHDAEIARENKLLVDKLYSISKQSYKAQRVLRAGGDVPPPGLRAGNLSMPELRTGNKVHEPLRRRNASNIEADNEALVGRILSVKKTINIKAFQKDFDHHTKYSKLRAKLSPPGQNLSKMSRSQSTPARGGKANTGPNIGQNVKVNSSFSSLGGGTRGIFLTPGDLQPVKKLTAGPPPPTVAVDGVPLAPVFDLSFGVDSPGRPPQVSSGGADASIMLVRSVGGGLHHIDQLEPFLSPKKTDASQSPFPSPKEGEKQYEMDTFEDDE